MVSVQGDPTVKAKGEERVPLSTLFAFSHV